MKKFEINNLLNALVGLLIMSSFLACKKKKEDSPAPGDNTDPEVLSMVVIPADDAKIRYTGRIDFSNAKAPAYSFSGVSIMAKFSGVAIDVIIKDYGTGSATTTNYYDVLIDDHLKTVLMVNSTDTLYKISHTLTDGNHTIELFKRTEANVGKSSFKGFRIQKGKTLLTLPAVSSRRVEFIGDSFTCGYGDEASIAAPPSGNPNTGFHSVNENNYNAWGAVSCRALEAQYVCTAYSGRGMYRNNTGSTTGTVPSFYNNIHPDFSGTTWNTSNYVPDVVVIHLGTNDFAPEAMASPSMVDSTTFVDTYISFVNTIRSNYPSAHIICIRPNSMTDYYPVGFQSLTRITHYIQAIVNHFSSDPKVYYFALTPQLAPYGEDWHPSTATQQSMADQIVPFILTKTGW
jgi:lysophospholipase L1-like esterase